jgi:hypothetical protein
MDRRTFLKGSSLAMGMVALASGAERPSLELQQVSTHDAPFVARRLKPGLLLTLRREGRKTWAMLSGNRIGLVPTAVASERCQITRVGRDERGRLHVSVRV